MKRIFNGVLALLLVPVLAYAGLQTQARFYGVASTSDTTPNAFSFTDQTNVATSTTVTSDAVTITGIDTAIDCTATGGTLDVNSSGSFASSQNVSNNDAIRARHNSSASNSTATNTVVDCNGISDTFTSTTEASGGGLLVSDGFESGDRSYTENGFTWATDNAAVSVVSSIAHTGTYSMRFDFTGTFAEQRWTLGGTEHDEVWISWYQYFPNGTEGVGPEVSRTAGGNNKLIRVFAFGQSVGGMGSETFTQSPAGDELANLEAALTDGSTAIGGISGTDCNGFLSDANKGRWFQIEFYFRPNQSHVTPNGAAALYIDGALCSSFSGLNSQTTPTTGIGAGYLWGSQNGAYANAGTYIYIDDFKISVTGRTGE